MENKSIEIRRKSTIYDNIIFSKNTNLEFNYNSHMQPNFKVYSPFHKQATLYYNSTARLFNEIPSLTNRHIWVCYKQSTIYPVRVYFTEPEQFPVSTCCNSIVYVEFLSDLSGCIKCPNCMKTMFQFVRAEKKEEQKEQKNVIRVKKKRGEAFERQGNKICEWNDTEPEKENDNIENRKIFQNFHDTIHQKKQLVSRLISSRKYKQRPLKKVLMTVHQDQNTKEFSDLFINQEFIIQTAVTNPDQKHKFNEESIINQERRSSKVKTSTPQDRQRQQLISIINDIFS